MKKLIALILSFLSVFTFASCEKTSSDKSTTLRSTSAPIVTKEQEKKETDEAIPEFETLETNVFQAAQENQWKYAYADYFSDTSIYKSVYVKDINGDGIPEVFTSLYTSEFPQKVTTHIKDNGLITFEFDLGSSIGGTLFFERYKNIVVLREDIHFFYHRAITYSLDTTGFVKKDEIWGDESEDEINYEDEAMKKKSRELFDKKFSEFTQGLNLIDYKDVAVSDNIKAYLTNKLGLDEI